MASTSANARSVAIFWRGATSTKAATSVTVSPSFRGSRHCHRRLLCSWPRMTSLPPLLKRREERTERETRRWIGLEDMGGFLSQRTSGHSHSHSHSHGIVCVFPSDGSQLMGSKSSPSPCSSTSSRSWSLTSGRAGIWDMVEGNICREQSSKKMVGEHQGIRAMVTNKDASSASPPQQAIAYSALLVDVGGTLLETAEPVEATYASIGARYGVTVTKAEIKRGFRKAFSEPWQERLRYEGDGRPFWRYAVSLATGSSDERLFEELYQHYARGSAWKLADGALSSLQLLREAGVKLAVASNFDNRLRPLLRELGVHDVFHSIIVSAEIGYEKPDVKFFQKALEQLDIKDPSTVVHVGDDPTADLKGANDAGIDCWLWKKDVFSFSETADRILFHAK